MSYEIKVDCFSVFGLEHSYFIDEEALNSSYIQQQSENHPDRFFNADDIQKAASLKKTAELNHAYSVLNSEEDRAKHLLEIAGVSTNGEEEMLQATDILEEVFELREKLAFAETSEEIEALKKESLREVATYKDGFNVSYQNKRFEEASVIYKKMVYKKKFLKEINLKYIELEK